jgi:4-diphosphocytidyl-2-C-methyl-D-erythritol kinase
MPSLAAHAKLNLFLHITGKREDGYHLLESLVVFTSLHDVLTIAESDTLEFSMDGEFAEPAGNDNNLVLRAARLLELEAASARGAALHLTKNIPVGAGLGGGSADAAAALRGLNDFWQLGLSEEKLMALGLKLGADVPMCLVGAPLVARGIGEEVTLLGAALPPMLAVLVHPRIPLLTAQVYAMADHHFPDHREGYGGADWLQRSRNDLQRPAIAASPKVAEVLLAMETVPPKPDLVRMTGSGACCFALFSDADRAANYAATLRAQYPEWWVWVTEIRP